MNPEEPKPEEATAEALREAAGDPLGAVEPAASEREPRENPVIGWARAIVLGIRDTANDVVDEGRKGARAKRSQMWDKFDSKTKHRRG